MNKYFFALFILATAVYLCGRYLWYGSLTSNCIYTERIIAVPQELASGKVVTTKLAYQAVGVLPENVCLPILGKIMRELVEPGVINNLSIGAKYYTQQGLRVEEIAAGREFHVEQILEITKHGLSTIDSGPGPIDYLVLLDREGQRYSLPTVGLGINRSDRFMKFISKEPAFLLSPEVFSRYDTGKSIFAFSPKAAEE